MSRLGSFAGVLLGTAVGDALGLPREAMSRRRAARMFGGAPVRHRFVLRRGMTSDDTEHTCMAGQALLASQGDPERFARSLAWRLRWWLLALPAGVGGATARAVLKLWLGFPPRSSGVWSAGNGPAMRSALLGVYAAGDPHHLRSLVRASTRLTHTDPAAEQGALLIALAASLGATHGPEAATVDRLLEEAAGDITEPKLLAGLETSRAHLASRSSPEEFAAALGLERGVGGWVNHTVPFALYCWLRSPDDYRAAVEAAVLAGGDTDTVAAITGALVGATSGDGGIPPVWLNGLAEWPRSERWMRRLAARLADSVPTGASRQPSGPLPLFWPGVLPRNVLFLTIVLAHTLRRMFPPY